MYLICRFAILCTIHFHLLESKTTLVVKSRITRSKSRVLILKKNWIGFKGKKQVVRTIFRESCFAVENQKKKKEVKS